VIHRPGCCWCHGWAPASLLLARLQAGSRRNPLAQALQEHGRLIKTHFVLAWLADEELRARVGRQLNKGEPLHALRRAVFYAHEGHVRHRTPEQQTGQALSAKRSKRWPERDVALVATFCVTGIRLAAGVKLNLDSITGPAGSRRMEVKGKGKCERWIPRRGRSAVRPL